MAVEFGRSASLCWVLMARTTKSIWHNPVKWGFTTVAILVAGPLAAMFTGALTRADGGTHATLFVSRSVVDALLAMGALVVLALVLGIPGARLFGQRFGLATAGFVFAWATWRTGEADKIIRGTSDASVLHTFAIEGAALMALTLGVVYAITRFGRARYDAEHIEFRTEPSIPQDLLRLVKPHSLAAIGAGTVGGAIVASVIAFDALKGQAVFAAFAGGIASAAFARLAGSMIRDDIPALAYFIPAGLLAILAPLAGGLHHGDASQVLGAVDSGTLLAVAKLTPLDWFAGALLGAPVGLSWIHSMLDQPSQAEDRRSGASAA